MPTQSFWPDAAQDATTGHCYMKKQKPPEKSGGFY
jgi:hypothetical protein